MRKKLHEIIGAPPEDQGRATPEYPALPEEFNRFAPTVSEEEKPSRLRKVMLLLAVAGLATVGVFRLQPQKTQASAEVQPTATAIATVRPNETPAPTPTPEPTAEPTAVPTPEPTFTPAPTPVILTGRIHIVVYADTFSRNLGGNGYDNAILADETFDAESFTEYTLPPLPTQSGYTAHCYVLIADSERNYIRNRYFDLGQPHAIGSVALPDGVVTADDLGIVPLNEEGVREAEIHTVWLSDYDSYVVEFYDGEEQIGSYPVAFPMDSDGLIYLAAFPQPEREGLIFNGWCDSLGNRIDAVMYFDFFEPLSPAPTLEDRNWRKPIPCKVYASWTDAYGNETGPAIPVPDCDAIFYQTHSVLNAAVTLTDRWRTTAVHVRIRDELVNDNLFECDLEEDYITFGFWAQEGIDLQSFYAKHRAEYESAGTSIQLVLEVTLDYEMPDGTTGTVVRTSEPQAEDYVMVEYHDAHEEPNEYTFPGCFVIAVYDAVTEDKAPFVTDRTKDLLPGEIYVGIAANYHRLSADQCRIECIADSYEYEGKTYTNYTYYLVFPKPDDLPEHGTATVTVRQRFLHYNFMRIDEHTVEY